VSWRARVPGAAGAVGRPAVRCAAPGDVVSIMAANAKAMAVRPALERRWDDALAAFGARGEIGVLGVPTRADPVEELSGTCAELRRGSQRVPSGLGGCSNSHRGCSFPAFPQVP